MAENNHFTTTTPAAEKRPLKKRKALAACPAAAVDVALIDAAKCAAIGDVSVSWWNAEVLAGRAPKPVVRQPRCTRWRLSEAREFWVRFAERGSEPEAAAALMTGNAKARTARRWRAIKGAAT